MKILVAGDTHGDVPFLEKLIKWAKRDGAELIIQLGDWGYTWPANMPKSWETFQNVINTGGIPFWFVMGNHDNYDWLKEIGIADATEPVELTPLVTYLPRASTFEIDGLKFMAMGGGVSIDKDPGEFPSTWPGRTEHYSWWSEELITDEDVNKAVAVGKVDVLLSHDAPNNFRLQQHLDRFHIPLKMDNLSRSNREAMTVIHQAVNPAVTIHGHYHYAYLHENDYTGQRIVGLNCNGRGRESYAILDTNDLKEAIK